VLEQYGIEPDSAVRLAQFEANYVQDPKGTIAALVDAQSDLPDAQKQALKALLQGAQSAGRAAGQGEEEDGVTPALPDEVREAVEFVRNARAEQAQEASAQRLEVVLSHWRSLDEAAGIKFPERQRLQYVQTAAAGGGFQTLEQLAEGARALALQDRDELLGGAIQRPRT